MGLLWNASRCTNHGSNLLCRRTCRRILAEKKKTAGGYGILCSYDECEWKTNELRYEETALKEKSKAEKEKDKEEAEATKWDSEHDELSDTDLRNKIK